MPRVKAGFGRIVESDRLDDWGIFPSAWDFAQAESVKWSARYPRLRQRSSMQGISPLYKAFVLFHSIGKPFIFRFDLFRSC